ncbi:MAG: type I restriction endonuclease subunit R, partial [Fluviicola sp.]
IDEAQLLIAYSSIQDEIINEQKEGEQKGFKTERERAVYNSMKLIFDVDAEDATKKLFDQLKGELDIVDWQGKGQVLKEIENKIMRFLKDNLVREDAKLKAKEMVDVLIKNKDA